MNVEKNTKLDFLKLSLTEFCVRSQVESNARRELRSVYDNIHQALFALGLLSEFFFCIFHLNKRTREKIHLLAVISIFFFLCTREQLSPRTKGQRARRGVGG